MDAFHEKVAEAKEKNKSRTDTSLFYVVRGLPNNLEIRSIPAKKDDRNKE